MSTTLISTLLLPPLLPLLAVVAGYLLLLTRRRHGWVLVACGWGALVLLSMPIVGASLLLSLETRYPDPLSLPADAIVVLGGGSYADAPEYGGDTVNGVSLERLRYAAQLYRRSGKPILVAGGNPLGNATAEAAQMKSALEGEWRIPVAWSEAESFNTLQNASNSYAILNAAHIHRIYLVTHASHMRRARFAFERAGFSVVPAPTRYSPRPRLNVASFLPSTEGLRLSTLFCRETLGLIWYRLRLRVQAG